MMVRGPSIGTFDICCYEVRSEHPKRGPAFVQAIVEVRLPHGCVRRSATGVGPVHALDAALRACLDDHFPELRRVSLCDYRVSVSNSAEGTASDVTVTIQATDGVERWSSVRTSANIVEASFEALCATASEGIARTLVA